MPVSNKPLVLCIEDDEDVRTLLAYQLKPHFDVVFAADGREGVRAAIYRRPDVIVMDLMLPTMDGVRATEMIRSVGALRDQPLVGLTAASKDLQQKALDAGCDLVIEKPAANLSRQLQELLRHHCGGAPADSDSTTTG